MGDAPIIFAVFGLGRMGRVHFQDLLACGVQAQVRWVVDIQVQKAQDYLQGCGQEGQVKVVSSAESDKALSDPSVHAVMICTPFPTHEGIIKRALAANKAVFCEKPLTGSLEATKSCYEAARKAGKPLFCAFNRRFDPQLRQMYNLTKAGELGELRVVKSVSRDPPGVGTILENPENIIPGSIFTESLVHDLDMLCWLVGERPVSLYVTGHEGKDGEADSVTAVLRFPGGVVGTAEVFGRNGMMISDQKRALELQHWSPVGMRQEPIYGHYVERYRDSYTLELHHFVDVIKGRVAEFDISPESVVMSATLTQLCQQAWATGQVLPLTWD